MGIDPLTIAIIGASIAAIGTGVSVAGSIESGHAQKKAEQARSQMQAIQAARERTQQVREARIKTAAVQAVAENQGAGGTSAAIGGQMAIQGQLGQNVSFIDQQVQAGEAISRANQQNINAQGLETLGAGAAKIGGSIFSGREEISAVKKDIFG